MSKSGKEPPCIKIASIDFDYLRESQELELTNDQTRESKIMTYEDVKEANALRKSRGRLNTHRRIDGNSSYALAPSILAVVDKNS